MTTIATPLPTTGPTRPTTLLCALGDSASAGVGDRLVGSDRSSVRDVPGSGWPAHLATLLGADLLNVGRNGARARDLLAEQLPTALAARPDLATVLVGGNDVLRGDYDRDEVRRVLLETVWQLLSTGAEVVLVAPPQLGPDLPAPAVVRRVLTQRMLQVRAVVAEVGAALRHERLLVVDADPVRGHGRGVFHIDRIHPSPLGHRLLASHVGTALRDRGWAVTGTVVDAPPPPGVALQAAWLVVRGTPWLARRSRDLLPELMRVVIAEEAARRRRTSTGSRRGPARLARRQNRTDIWSGSASGPGEGAVAGEGGIGDVGPVAAQGVAATVPAEAVEPVAVAEQE